MRGNRSDITGGRDLTSDSQSAERLGLPSQPPAEQPYSIKGDTHMVVYPPICSTDLSKFVCKI
jgi:hypothetical protein